MSDERYGEGSASAHRIDLGLAGLHNQARVRAALCPPPAQVRKVTGGYIVRNGMTGEEIVCHGLWSVNTELEKIFEPKEEPAPAPASSLDDDDVPF